MKHNRKVGSIKKELAIKAREAMLSAVEIYNNPNVQFKSETFIVLSIIAWTYLMHAYFKGIGVDYSYYEKLPNGRKKYNKTKYGAKKHWELERCLNDDHCPIDFSTKENLKFLIGLRHEIEHQMTTKIDDALSARFQACCINFNSCISEYLGENYNISKHLSFSLQFSSLSEEHIAQLKDYKDLPANIATYINSFDDNINEEVFNDPKYSYRVIFVPKTVNHKGQADKVIEFIPSTSPLAEGINKEYVVIKEREKKKLLPGAIVKLLKEKGYTKLNMHHFVKCWKENDAQKDNTYGARIGDNKWYWYENFIPVVENYCITNNLL